MGLASLAGLLAFSGEAQAIRALTVIVTYGAYLIVVAYLLTAVAAGMWVWRHGRRPGPLVALAIGVGILGYVLYDTFVPFPAAPFNWVVMAAGASLVAGAAVAGRAWAGPPPPLAAAKAEPAFAPEPLGPTDQAAMSHEARSLARRAFRLLASLPSRPAPVEEVLARGDEVLERLQDLLAARVRVERIRCHGDLHLGQVLWTGKDFVVTGIGGTPARSEAHRRRKRPALVDVAGMLGSLHDAARVAATGLHLAGAGGDPPADSEPWLPLWWRAGGGASPGAYPDKAAGAGFIPERHDERAAPLDVAVVRKLGVPDQPELAMGAVGEGGVTVRNEPVLHATAEVSHGRHEVRYQRRYQGSEGQRT